VDRASLAARAQEGSAERGFGGLVGYGLVVAVGLALFVSPFASRWPDGLERIAARLGFEQKAVGGLFPASAMGGYHMPGVASAAKATALAGAVGTVVVFLLSLLLVRLLAPADAGKGLGDKR